MAKEKKDFKKEKAEKQHRIREEIDEWVEEYSKECKRKNLRRGK